MKVRQKSQYKCEDTDRDGWRMYRMIYEAEREEAYSLPCECMNSSKTKTKLNTVALVRERTISTERPLLAGKVSANFC
jgi:hypothetical protein